VNTNIFCSAHHDHEECETGSPSGLAFYAFRRIAILKVVLALDRVNSRVEYLWVLLEAPGRSLYIHACRRALSQKNGYVAWLAERTCAHPHFLCFSTTI